MDRGTTSDGNGRMTHFGQHLLTLLSGEKSYWRKTGVEVSVNWKYGICSIYKIFIQKCHELQWITCLWVIVSLLQTFLLTDSTSDRKISYFEASNRNEETIDKWNQSCCQFRETTDAEILSMFSQGFRWLGLVRQIDNMLSQHFLSWVTRRKT